MPKTQYGAAHQAERKRWTPKVARGGIVCRRSPYGMCLEENEGRPATIAPGTPWDLGDPDDACAAPKAPEHRRCNRATGTHRVTAQTRRQSRDWVTG